MNKKLLKKKFKVGDIVKIIGIPINYPTRFQKYIGTIHKIYEVDKIYNYKPYGLKLNKTESIFLDKNNLRKAGKTQIKLFEQSLVEEEI